MRRGAEAMRPVAIALRLAAERLGAAGIAAPRRDARLLVAHALDAGIEQVVAYPERPMSAEQLARLESLVDRRARREPVSRILGRREFWGLDFTLCEATLDPRPDSETLVEAVLDWVGSGRDQVFRILDLGCGTGCLLLALLSELPAAKGLGIDIAPAAVATAQHNARHLGLAGRAAFAVRSWQDGLPAPDGARPWDIIVSNPPYIPSDQIAGLAPEVADHDPRMALDGGPDGLAAYRSLLPPAAEALSDAGLLALEVGVGQAKAVCRLLEQVDFPTIWTTSDLSGIERCVLATRAGNSRAFAPDSAPAA